MDNNMVNIFCLNYNGIDSEDVFEINNADWGTRTWHNFVNLEAVLL